MTVFKIKLKIIMTCLCYELNYIYIIPYIAYNKPSGDYRKACN